MRPRRRDIEVFSLSFLDCICCAFGAIILLFVLSKFGEPLVIEQTRTDLDAAIIRLEEEKHDIRGESLVIERELEAKRIQLTEAKKELARLQGDLSAIEGEYAAARDNAEVQNIIEGRMARTLQDLTEEMKRLSARRPPKPNASVGGIPVDSEYIIFIIDTSGSMQRGAWGTVQKKIRETLNVYPKVKGIQIMNDMGDYMFPQYRDRWIPDTKRRREVILEALATWQPFSNSSPVEGITMAIQSFYDPKKNISLYVFGDEYSGRDMQAAVKAVDKINRAGPGGKRRVRIHAVGFPTVLTDPRGITGIRFAALMRAICERNGGAFVGLNRARP
ncbi:MAG: VWA domain-containing protein [Desulfobacteraceae bacterium]|nr:VWA domain-containing protein [Desulfobacteraceae bacterium]MBC2751800.1 VWA domain-containing protein [Desulfobacteraceae bacterium]